MTQFAKAKGAKTIVTKIDNIATTTEGLTSLAMTFAVKYEAPKAMAVKL